MKKCVRFGISWFLSIKFLTIVGWGFMVLVSIELGYLEAQHWTVAEFSAHHLFQVNHIHPSHIFSRKWITALHISIIVGHKAGYCLSHDDQTVSPNLIILYWNSFNDFFLLQIYCFEIDPYMGANVRIYSNWVYPSNVRHSAILPWTSQTQYILHASILFGEWRLNI